MSIIINNNAIKRISDLRKKNKHNKYLRINILTGGCNGFQYELAFVDNINYEQDHLIKDNNDNIYAICNKKFTKILDNSEIDYSGDIMSRSFKILNPNASSKCGCGNSFSI